MRPAGRLRPDLLALVALGGAAGACVRYAVSLSGPAVDGVGVGTLVVNVAGTLLLGVLVVLPRVRRSPRSAALLGPGLLGGFTTLSAYAEETRALAAAGRPALAAGYATATLAGCLLAALLGGRVGLALAARRGGGRPAR